ncbi:MAG: VCBS repeat-containing protein, partial [Myxococcota bacterium]
MNSFGPPAFVILESEVGPVPVLGVDTDSCFTSYNFATSDLTVELIDADGVNGSDLLVFDRENPGLFSPRGATPTRDSPFDGEFPLPPEAQGRSIGVGPLFGSRDDLVSRVDESRLNVLSYDDSLGNYVALNPAIGATSSRGLAPRIGDFDGDGDNDIVEAADSALLVHLNPGDGTSAFETRTVDLGAIVVAYAVGELAGGAPGADIAVLVREAADPDDELATASLFIVSNLTVPSMPVAGGIEFVLTSGGPLDDQHQNILLEVEDANRDGTDDIFVVRAVSEDEATAVFFTRPDTEWREVAFFEDAIEARPERVRFLDVNADGDTDILLFLNDNSVAVYLGLSGAELNFIQSDDVALNGRDVAVLVGENTTDFVIASIEGASDRTVRICITPEIPPPPSDLYREDSTDEELQGDPSLLLVTDRSIGRAFDRRDDKVRRVLT